MRRIAALFAVTAAFAAALMLPAAGSADEDCLRQNVYAKFLEPAGGQVSANSQAGGVALTILDNQMLPSFSFSTTGEINVEIEHKCIQELQLTVYKDGVAAPIHTNSWSPLGCDLGTKSDTVTIGLDGGTYKFFLDGVSCSGVPLKRTEQGGFVGDPPLPL